MRILIFLLLLAGTANAQELFTNSTTSTGTIAWTRQGTQLPLVVSSSVEIFRMSEGACLKGPLVINDGKGNEKFRLERDIDYPTGCSKK